jgi:hypothetical protein
MITTRLGQVEIVAIANKKPSCGRWEAYLMVRPIRGGRIGAHPPTHQRVLPDSLFETRAAAEAAAAAYGVSLVSGQEKAKDWERFESAANAWTDVLLPKPCAA